MSQNPQTSSHRSKAHRTGLNLIRKGDYAGGVRHLAAAIEEQPMSSPVQADFGVALAKSSRLTEALAAFQKAIELDPANEAAHRNLGLTLARQGKLAEAETSYRAVMELKPDSAQSHYDLAKMLRTRKKTAEAVAEFQEAVRLDPENSTFLHDLGLSQVDLGRRKDAEASYRRALELDPKSAQVHCNLGILLQDLGRLDEAIALLSEAVRLNPNSDDSHNNLGVALAASGKPDEAVTCYRKALALNPKSAMACNNLGNSLRAIGLLDEAIPSLQRALDLDADYAEAFNNLGICYIGQRNHEAALRCYQQALRLKPDYPEAHLNRALAWLAQGDFERGWSEYEWRWKVAKSQRPAARRWDGASLEGRTILLTYEQGLGDTLQFVRYAPLLKQRGARVVLQCQASLSKLLAKCPGIDQAVTSGKVDYDYHVPLMSLPGLLTPSPAAIPAPVPYLKPEPTALATWAERLANLAGFKIGIAWQGNSKFRADRQRSMPLTCFAPLAQVPGVQLVSLQKGPGREQLANVAGKWPMVDWSEQLHDFSDTAALMCNLDLIVCCDTSVAHLAGALGLQVWVAVPFAADWRWLLDRSDSPWYPTMRLFRQQSRGDWPDVFARISEAVREVLSHAAPTTIDENAAIQDEARVEHRQGLQAMRSGDLAESLACFERATELWRDFSEAHNDLGVALARLGRQEQARQSFLRALELRPSFRDAHGNVALAEAALGNFESAARHFAYAIELGAGSAENHNNLGLCLVKLGQRKEALNSFRRALWHRPHFPEAHVNLGRCLLAVGEFEQGWLEYKWRTKCTQYSASEFPQPQWTGGPLAGKTILVTNDDRNEDMLQLARYAAHLKRLGAQVLVEVPQPLISVMKGCKHVDRVVEAGAHRSRFDCFVRACDLPALLGTTLTTIPAAVPYLVPSGQLVDKWRPRLPRGKSFRIGIAWRGDASFERGVNGNIPLACFAKLLEPGVQLIGWQLGHDLKDFPLQRRPCLVDVAADDNGSDLSYEDVAALFSQLDLVVAADSCAAHIGGALGVKVWVALPHASHPRWLLEREDSPWYPTMRLFRQHRDGDWDGVFERIASALREHLDHRKEGLPQTTETDTAEALRREGVRFINNGQLAKAIQSLRQALEINPRLAAVRQDLGVAFALQRDFPSAIEHFTYAIHASGNSTAAFSNLARAFWDFGDLEAAERTLRQAIAVHPQSASLHIQLGRLLSERKKTDKAPSRGAPCEILAPLVDHGPVRTKQCRHGTFMFLPNDKYVGRALDKYGEFSEAETQLFRQMIIPGATVLEVGANLGAHTVFLAKAVGPNGKLLAFEPQRVLYQLMTGNIAINGLHHVDTYNAAVGRENGTLKIPQLDYSASRNFGGVSIDNCDAGDPIRLMTVDSLELLDCHFMKVDVEGMEGDVIAGAEQTLHRCRPILYIENDRRQKSAALISQLFALDYRLYWHLPRMFNADNYFEDTENIFGDIVSVNMLCLHASQSHAVKGLVEITNPEDDWRVAVKQAESVAFSRAF